MVRTSFINEINNTISSSDFFDVTDFNVQTETKNSAEVLQIEYKYDSRFFYVASIPLSSPDSNNYRIQFTAAPGEIIQKETGAVESKTSLSRSIYAWLNRVKEELVATPLHRKLTEHKRELEAMFERLKDVEDVAFTREEAAHLKEELEKLKEQMIEQIQHDSANKQEQAARISAITKDLDALKASVDILNKPNWARAAVSRFYTWTKDPANRGLLKDGVEVATKLLTGNVEK